MKLPRDPEDLLPALAALGAAISLSKLLSSKQALTWRAVIGRSVEGAALAMCSGVALLLPAFIPALKEVHPMVLLAIGGMLASLGVVGLLSLVRAVRGGVAGK